MFKQSLYRVGHKTLLLKFKERLKIWRSDNIRYNHAMTVQIPRMSQTATYPRQSMFHSLWDILCQRLWLFIPFLSIPALWPFYTHGLPRSFDGPLHLLRLSMLDYHLRHGTLYPRWIPEMMLGYGYPVFNFYSPSTYYIAELFHLAGLNYIYSFMAFMALALSVAGFGMYLLARSTFGVEHSWAALLSATTYMYAPYLLTNIYIRGAIAEVGALALLPWVFWSVRSLLRNMQAARYIVAVVFSLSGVALTHNITLLLTPPLLFPYILIHWWQSDQKRYRFYLLTISLLLAMGISAFFWLPLMWERGYLSNTAYLIAKTQWLPRSMWTWQNILDIGWSYNHTFARPIRLGIIQLILAIAGFVLARRRDAEWLYFLMIALIAGLIGGEWALPLWVGNDILPILQFPWRLLSFISLSLALFTGGLVLWIRPAVSGMSWRQMIMGLVFLVITLFAYQPHLGWMKLLSPISEEMTLPLLAQIEQDKGAEVGGSGNSSVQEFRPRWSDVTLQLEPSTDQLSSQAAQEANLFLHQANAYALKMSVESKNGLPLRFKNFYFPGWQAILDEKERLVPYPSTNLGLLTVDIPPGRHELHLAWAGTSIQQWVGILSLLALLIFMVILWRQLSQRYLLILPAISFLFGIAAFLWQRPMMPVHPPTQAVTSNGIELLGLRWERDTSNLLYLYPYWYVRQPPSRELRFKWQLQDGEGNVVSETSGLPYFNTSRASHWAVGSVIDDAYQLPLPSRLSAGVYQIAVQMGTTDAELDGTAYPIGEVTLYEPAPALPQPMQTTHVRFDDSMHLMGFDVTVNREPVDESRSDATLTLPPIAYRGDRLAYTLYWQASDSVSENYHSFIHLTDIAGQPLIQEDHIPGPIFQPPMLWNAYHLHPDVYLFRIPSQATGGLYWPSVGIYDFDTLHRLPVWEPGRNEPGDHFRLSPVKIVGQWDRRPSHTANIRFGDFATLAGYDLQLSSEQQIRPESSFTLQLYYRCETTPKEDYVRFTQLYNPALGMAAQYDSLPLAGINPTWSWVKDEEIVDSVELQIAADASPGLYMLYVGFYDRQSGERVSVTDEAGNQVPERWGIITQIEVRP